MAREFVFSGSSLDNDITLVTDSFDTSIRNLTVMEIRRGQSILSELPELGTLSQTEVALLSDFKKISYNDGDLKDFAAIRSLKLTRRDNANSETTIVDQRAGLTALSVSAINFVSGNTVRYTFSGTPDLSAVVAGDVLYFSGADSEVHDGLFHVIDSDDTNDTIDVIIPSVSDDTDDQDGAGGTGVVSIFN